MDLFTPLFFCVGLIVGSFLNVAILRLHTGQSLSGRSGCMSCRAQLQWYELLPLVSFFVLRGRCRSCGSSVSHQYWIVELTTAALFTLVAVQGWDLVVTTTALAMVAVLVVLAVYDIRHTILPNALVYLFAGLALVAHVPFVLALPLTEALVTVAGVLIAGGIVAAPLFVLWLVSRGAWMGLGDVKLALGVGWALGALYGFVALMIAFVTGALVGVALLYAPRVMRALSLSGIGQQFTMKSEIPFGPFIIGGFFISLFWGSEIVIAFSSLFI